MSESTAIIDYETALPDHLNKMHMLEIVKKDPMTMEIVIQRVIDGESLKQIATAWKLPATRFVKWISDDDERLAQYEGALKVRADELIHEAMHTAQYGDDIQRDKLVVETKFRVASMWDRQRYGGEKATGGSGINIIINRGGAEMPAENTVTIDG
ncbi:MAG: hypothetical protein ABL868_08150 [Sulfuriferula sp.]